MTEEQMDKLAEIVAVKVMDRLIAKQQEWDKQFNEQFEEATTFKPKLSDKVKLEMSPYDLSKARITYRY